MGVFREDSGIFLGRYNPFPGLSQKFPAISQLYFSCGYSPPARLRFAAEASKNLENAAAAPTRWIAAVSAAEDNF